MDDRTKRNEGRGNAARAADVGTETEEVVGAMQRPPGGIKRVARQKRNFLAMESFSVLTRTL